MEASNCEPTLYQRRYLVYCEKTGREPGEFPIHDFISWVHDRLIEFREREGLTEWDRLGKKGSPRQEAFSQFLEGYESNQE